MTTKTDITLPPLPDMSSGALKAAFEEYARAAVEADRKQRHLKEESQLEREWVHLRAMQAQYEADRQGRMPSDAEILACLRPLYSNDVAAAMGAEDDLRTARLLLSRYAAPVADQAQPAMPPLTEAMRAVLRNEHCVYDSEDTLYAALCNAAGTAPSAQDWEDAAFEAVRQQLCRLPRYSFTVHRGGVRRSRDTAGNWLEFDQVHALFDPVAIDAARAAKGSDHD